MVPFAHSRNNIGRQITIYNLNPSAAAAQNRPRNLHEIASEMTFLIRQLVDLTPVRRTSASAICHLVSSSWAPMRDGCLVLLRRLFMCSITKLEDCQVSKLVLVLPSDLLFMQQVSSRIPPFVPSHAFHRLTVSRLARGVGPEHFRSCMIDCDTAAAVSGLPSLPFLSLPFASLLMPSEP